MCVCIIYIYEIFFNISSKFKKKSTEKGKIPKNTHLFLNASIPYM